MYRKLSKSFKYAFQGILEALKERNFKIMFLAFFIGLSYFVFQEKIKLIIYLTISFNVLIIEMLNTAIENIVDHLFKENNETARIIKDLSAGATLLSVLLAVVIGVLLL